MLDFLGPMTPVDWHTSAQALLASAHQKRLEALANPSLGEFWKDCYRLALQEARIRLQAKRGVISETAAFNQIADLMFSRMESL